MRYVRGSVERRPAAGTHVLGTTPLAAERSSSGPRCLKLGDPLERLVPQLCRVGRDVELSGGFQARDATIERANELEQIVDHSLTRCTCGRSVVDHLASLALAACRPLFTIARSGRQVVALDATDGDR